MKRLLFLLPLLATSAWCQIAPAPAPAPAPPVVAKEASDYIRFLEVEGGPDLLQTAITRFRKGRDTVDLVAVVHLGDAAYYEGLNDYLQNFDLVLYEMVGGTAEQKASAEPEDSSVPEMASVRQLQQMAKSFLGLEFQLDGIDYSAENFIHADVDWEKYDQLMTARNQSFATLFSRAMSLSQSGDIPGVPSNEADINAMLGSILTAITTGDGTGLKRTLAPMLSEAEGFISLLEGEDGTVLVTGRNKVVMEKLSEVRSERAAGNYAIFYGAGHMPDLEARLLADGFRKVETGWADAWSMEKPTSANGLSAGEPVNATDFLIRMLQDNPEVMSAVEQLSDVLRKLQETE
jgi:hypothetical protein